MSETDAMDFLQVDRLFTEEERATRERVKTFVAEHVLPYIEGWFERGEFPTELARGFGELGILGMHLDGFGCAGESAVQYGLANQEVEYGDSGLRSFVSVQGSLAMFPIRTFGSKEQRQEWLPRMATGEAIGCFAASPNPGAVPTPRAWPRSPAVTAATGSSAGTRSGTPTGRSATSRLSGLKDEGDTIRGFVVPSATPGVEFRSLDNAWSLRAAARSELLLHDVRLPADAVLPGVEGIKGPLSCLTEARFGIAWGTVGAARACYEAALNHSKTRVQFGKPIGAFQLVQRKLVEMAIDLNAAALLAIQLGRLKDDDEATFEQVSMVKLSNARTALAVAREARSVLGATGITFDAPVIRHMNNLKSVITYEGTEEIHTLIVGAALTGLRAFE